MPRPPGGPGWRLRSATGRGADVIVIDDPQKPDQDLSDVGRKASTNGYDNTLLSCLNNKRSGCIIIVMQRIRTTWSATCCHRTTGRCCRSRRSSRRRNACGSGRRMEPGSSPESPARPWRGFPPREIRRRYKALARPGPVCGSHLAGLSASSCRMRLRVSMPQNSVSQMPVGLSDGDAGHAYGGADRGFRAVSERIELVGGFPNRLISASSFTLREWGRRGWVFPCLSG